MGKVSLCYTPRTSAVHHDPPSQRNPPVVERSLGPRSKILEEGRTDEEAIFLG